MFEVYDKRDENYIERINNIIIFKKKTVYSIQYKNGYPFFTFYEDGQWITRSAKYYIPVEN